MIKMDKWGTVLTGRHLGREVREKILKEIQTRNVIIDFGGVEIASHSFCDEVFGFLTLKIEDLPSKIKFHNANDGIKSTLKYVISERLRMKNEMSLT